VTKKICFIILILGVGGVDAAHKLTQGMGEPVEANQNVIIDVDPEQYDERKTFDEQQEPVIGQPETYPYFNQVKIL